MFGHICESPRLAKIARAHRLPPNESKRAGQRTQTLCVLGDFGFRRANMYLELERGQRAWLYDAAAADRLGETAPIVTLEAVPQGRLSVGCAGCDPNAHDLRETEEGALGAMWIDLAGGRLHVREDKSRRELAATAGLEIKDRLFIAIPTDTATCGEEECELMALAIYLPVDEARAWRRSVGKAATRR